MNDVVETVGEPSPKSHWNVRSSLPGSSPAPVKSIGMKGKRSREGRCPGTVCAIFSIVGVGGTFRTSSEVTYATDPPSSSATVTLTVQAQSSPYVCVDSSRAVNGYVPPGEFGGSGPTPSL